MSSDRTFFDKLNQSAKGLFSKKETVDSFDYTIQSFQTAEYCFVHIETMFNIHLSRLSDKVARENAVIKKIPGMRFIFNYGIKPTANDQYQVTEELAKLAAHDLKTPFAETLNEFLLLWDKKKFRLTNTCDVDMPFSDAAKCGALFVSRIDKIIQKIEYFLNIARSIDVSEAGEDESFVHTPSGAAISIVLTSTAPPSYEESQNYLSEPVIRKKI